MSTAELTALLLFCTAMSFSPGPNTTLSTALAANLGLKRALRFCLAVPTGWTLLMLGSGLGRDSAIATEGERASGRGWLAFVERSFEAYRAYYEYLPQGTTSIEYTVRLNNVRQFAQPGTRVEALYAPEVFGVAPNAAVKVEAR